MISFHPPHPPADRQGDNVLLIGDLLTEGKSSLLFAGDSPSASMATISGSLVSASVSNPRSHFITGSSPKVAENGHMCLNTSYRGRLVVSRKPLIIRAGLDEERSSSVGLFVGGFVLGGLIVGALGCVYAPQISKALAGANRRELMSRLPKFIYDEEKALERTRKILAEKIEQLNSAIDEVSAQLRADDPPNGSAMNTDEIEATI